MGRCNNLFFSINNINIHMRNALVLQPFGLGDCIFAQTLVNSLGFDNIIWPVVNQYLDDLRRAYPNILWCEENLRDLNYPWAQVIAIPIRWSDTIQKVPYQYVMRAKYDMYRLRYEIWPDQAMWKRNAINESKLFMELGLDGLSEYNLISQNFTGKFKARQIPVNNGLRNIYLNPINGYSLFDWALVMERATEIHFVSSSSLYMLECLSPKANRICIYQRSADEPHNRYDYLFTKHKYNWL